VPPLRHKLIVSSYRDTPAMLRQGSVPPLRHKLIVSSYRDTPAMEKSGGPGAQRDYIADIKARNLVDQSTDG
jgi:hypothetical protein